MLAFGQQKRVAAWAIQPFGDGGSAVDFDGGREAIKYSDGAVGGVVTDFDGAGLGGGGFEIAIEIKNS